MNEGMALSQENQVQFPQREASHQPRPGGRRPKMGEEQRKERKKLIDMNYRLRKKNEETERTAQNEYLLEENRRLSTENSRLKEANVRLSAESGHFKEESSQLSTEKRHLKEDNERLTLENKCLEERIRGLQRKGQLPAEVPQTQDSYISQSTSQVDHPSISIQNCDLELSHDLENLHQTAETCIITHMKLLEKIYADEESGVKVSDFTGLDEHRELVGKYSFPLSLVSTVKRIIDIYGDISVARKINLKTAETIYILFCASIKEMDEIKLEQLTEDRLLKWRDAIKDDLRINFRVEFAMEHLKKIVHAYIGRKERQEHENMTQTISILEADLNAKKEELTKRKEQSKEYMDDVEEFNGKSLSLFT